MAIEDAAKSLHDFAKHHPDFVAVGVGNGELILYLTPKRAGNKGIVFPMVHEGFVVFLKRTGRPKTA